MPIARIIDGIVSEVRDLSLDDVPPHKRHLWLPVEGEPPVIDATLQKIEGPHYRVDDNRVVRVWVVSPLPPQQPSEQENRIAVLESDVARLIVALTALAAEASK